MENRTPLLNTVQKPTSYQSIIDDEVVIESENLSTWQLIKLTICLTGLQFTWTVELSYGTPYLKSLGLSPELVSLVWLAGPLSGLIIQPLVGGLSDKSTFSIGRRRPYIIIGAFMVCLSMAGIAYAKEWATLLVVQASCRALILDVAPLYQQEIGNAWASRMMHFGNVIGYFTGFLNLLDLFPLLGNSQLKILCVIACTVFISSILITCLSTREVVYEPIDEDMNTTWIAEIYLHWYPNDPDFLVNAARAGSFGLLMYSFVSVAAAMILPQLTPTSHSSPNNPFTLYNIYTSSLALFSILMMCTYFVRTVTESIILIAFVGIPWSVTMWVPFTLVGEYVRLEHELQLQQKLRLSISSSSSSSPLPSPNTDNDIVVIGAKDVNNNNNKRERTRSDNIGIKPRINQDLERIEGGIDSGIILGVHNIYVVAPQFIVSLISACIFSLLRRINNHNYDHGGGANEMSDDGTGWVLRFGGLMSLVAAFLSRYLIDLQVYRT
ncbi:7946_t:CDS:2 [Entrophospora sp. SA101]|nr:7946_t:CDS:2 [Entrophospora sp. SA101]